MVEPTDFVIPILLFFIYILNMTIQRTHGTIIASMTLVFRSKGGSRAAQKCLNG